MTTRWGAVLFAVIFAANLSFAAGPTRQQVKDNIQLLLIKNLDKNKQAGAKNQSIQAIAEGMTPSERSGAVSVLKQGAENFKNNPVALAEIANAMAHLKEPAIAKELARSAITQARAKGDTNTIAIANSVLRLSRDESSAELKPEGVKRLASNARFDNSLGHGHQQKIMTAIERAGMTEKGKKNIVMVSKTQFRKAKKTGIWAGETKTIDINGQKMYAVSIPRDELQGDADSFAAMMSGKMAGVKFYDANDGKVSKISLKTVELLETVYTSIQLKALSQTKSVACAISTALCNKVESWKRAVRGDFDTTGLNDENSKMLNKMAENDPGNGVVRAEEHAKETFALDAEEQRFMRQSVDKYTQHRTNVRSQLMREDAAFHSQQR